MRLHPQVSVEEALAWLEAQANATWNVEPSAELGQSLQSVAEAMAAVSAVVLPEDIEPLAL